MNSSTERAVLWGMQHLLRRYPGVVSTRVGYTGGEVRHATYRDHGTHAEALDIIFDPAGISYRKILEFFFIGLSLPRGTRRGEHYGGWDRAIV